MRRSRNDVIRQAERRAGAVTGARSIRQVAAGVAQVEQLDAMVRSVAAEEPAALAAVEASYVAAVASLSEKAALHGWSPNRPRELFAAWVADAVAPESLAGLRSFVDEFWSGPRLSYAEVRAGLPRVQHLRRLHDLAARTDVWQRDPSWPDTAARSALELASSRWAERGALSHAE